MSHIPLSKKKLPSSQKKPRPCKQKANIHFHYRLRVISDTAVYLHVLVHTLAFRELNVLAISPVYMSVCKQYSCHKLFAYGELKLYECMSL